MDFDLKVGLVVMSSQLCILRGRYIGALETHIELQRVRRLDSIRSKTAKVLTIQETTFLRARLCAAEAVVNTWAPGNYKISSPCSARRVRTGTLEWTLKCKRSWIFFDRKRNVCTMTSAGSALRGC